MPVDVQFDAWRPLDEEGNARLPTCEASAGFGAAFSSWTLGEIVLTHAVFSGVPARQWWHRPKSDPDHCCVVLVRTRAGDGTPREELCVRSPALALERRVRDGEIITLHLPRDRRPAEEPCCEKGHDVAVSRELAPLLSRYMDGLVRSLPHLGPEQAASLEAPTRALVAACLAPAPAAVEPARPVLGSALVDRVRSVVRQNMASPDFGPEGLARLLAMSRSKLYRLFEQSGGVAHFINRERLREAHRRLSAHTETLSIHAIGNEVGFVDHSTFSRAFRREFGYSPTEARERGLAQSFAEECESTVQG
ncbi:helix-turn-helix domain-containing protein [Bosea sp. (in: a-proteobacteria)]|uniref:helix-turn-helix domain-containing protein n=1 Tax=Bosea sp. (in: a-proteobacteria) TaxID=1871050 RepID=UPI00262D5523|nr:helix-turn-helix domain-containing protein [Bosea sp. (in: a-proteobacteria)]MCO5091066.1 helix-turn-helix domain-containing protein [Bosea sp. (in: a-proteobacteria)]